MSGSASQSSSGGQLCIVHESHEECNGSFDSAYILFTDFLFREPYHAANDTFLATVTSVATFPSFEAMLSTIPLAKILPGVESVAEGVSTYGKFYTTAEQSRYSVVAIGIAVVDDNLQSVEPDRGMGTVFEWLANPAAVPRFAMF